MSYITSRIYHVLGLSVLGCSVLIWGGLLTDAHADTIFGGQGTVVHATVLGLQTRIVDTEPLPPEGGTQEDTLVNAELPGVLNANALHAIAIGQGDSTLAEASVADVEVTVGLNHIGVDLLQAQATAICDFGYMYVIGISDVFGLVINGKQINVTGQPNQTIPLLNGTVIINEQFNGSSALTVTALHIIVNGIADIALSQANADITCDSEPPAH